MKKFILWGAFGFSALGVCCLFFYLAGEPEKVAGKLKPIEKVAASTETASSLSPNSASSQKPETTTPATPQQVAPKEAATVSEKQRIFEAIEEAAISYNAAQLPQIQPFLVHPDPQIRAAAVQGMVTLGDAAAGPMLRQAARLAPYAKEAAAMEEAADYVELPSASMLPKNRRKR